MHNPMAFPAVIFSLNAKIEPTHTKTMPMPLNRGNMITDGTFPAMLVITKLIMQRENALPAANGSMLLTFLFCAFSRWIKILIIKQGMKNE